MLESSLEFGSFPKLVFDWDEHNIGHLALRQITPSDAEQVILNRPVDLESELRNGEKRTAQVGETDAGKVLAVVSTEREGKIRVITAWPAKDRLRRYFLSLKRNGNVGRIED
jgi:uncharacterized DUF497 family protein